MWFGEIYAGTAWPPHLDCLDLSNSMESVCVCPGCTSMKVQTGYVMSSCCVFMATYDPRIEAMAEFPGGGLGGGPE